MHEAGGGLRWPSLSGTIAASTSPRSCPLHMRVRLVKKESVFHPGCSLLLDPSFERVGNTRHPSRVTSLPVAASGGGTIIPHARGTGLGRAGPTLITACRSHKGKRSADPDPARVIEPRGVRRTGRPLRSGRLEGSPLRQLTEGRVTPDSNQQL